MLNLRMIEEGIEFGFLNIVFRFMKANFRRRYK